MSDLAQGPNHKWDELVNRADWSPYLEIGAPLPPESGVYMVHVMAGETPMSLSRASGSDAMGVLLIGESEHLLSRGKTLSAAMRWQGGTGTPPSHRPGLEYSYGWGYHFARKFPLEQLRIRSLPTTEHKLLEAALLESYRWEFLDRPPLNASIGNWRQQHRCDRGWLTLEP